MKPNDEQKQIVLLDQTALASLKQYAFWLLLIVFLVVFLSALGPILAPFIIAAASAYIGDPFVDYLERLKLSRTLAVGVVFTLMTLFIIILALIFLPLLIKQIDLLQQYIPYMIQWLDKDLMPRVYGFLGVDSDTELLAAANNAIATNWEKISDVITVLITQATQSSLAIIGLLAGLMMIPVVTFYLLRDWDVLMAHIADLMPRKQLPVIQALAKECDEVLGQFIRGQLLIMFSLSVFYILGLSIIGLKLALLVGLIAGLASVVPYLGALVGMLAASLAAYLQFGELLYVVIALSVFGAGQLLESLFLTPLLVGDRIGLHPVAVIFAVIAGGQLAGFVGVLLALPVAAVLMVLMRHAHHNYRSSVFYQ